MKEVFQTKFGGSDSPIEEQGDCFQACLASIFEIPLHVAFDDKVCKESEWFDKLNEWLAPMGLGCLYIPIGKTESGKPFAPGTTYLGYHIMEFTSINLKNPEDGHAVVGYNGSVVHNPREGQGITDVGQYLGASVFLQLDASVVFPR